MMVTIEDTKKMLGWLATILKYGKPEIFNSEMTAKVYHNAIQHFEYEFVKNKILELPYRFNEMPTPREFMEFFGIVPPDPETTAQLIQSQIRQFAQNNTPLSVEAKSVLSQIGVSSYDVKYNTKLLDSLTTKKIALLLKTKPMERSQKNMELKNKNLLSKPQEIKPTQNPIKETHEKMREEADKLVEKGTDKYMLGECVKKNNIRNPLNGFKFKDLEHE
jgi:hypothetical protein